MKNALARAVLLAAWACSSPCWGQAAKAGPGAQIATLQNKIAELESENAALKEALANGRKGRSSSGSDGNGGVDKLIAGIVGAGVGAAGTRAIDERRIKQASDENNALRKSLEEAQGTVKQRGDELQATQSRLKAAETDLQSTKKRLEETLAEVRTLEASAHDLQKRLDASNATVDTQRHSIEELKRTIDRLQGIIDRAGPPLWPWGGIAAAAALVLATAVTRRFWPKFVRQPLAVNIELGDWIPKATPKGLAPSPRFSIRTELIPQFSSIRPTGKSLVHEVRGIQQGAVQ